MQVWSEVMVSCLVLEWNDRLVNIQTMRASSEEAAMQKCGYHPEKLEEAAHDR